MSLLAAGDVEQDFWLALDLLRSSKDHAEFSCVRDWIQEALEEVCSDVVVEVPKSVLKQVRQLCTQLMKHALRQGATVTHSVPSYISPTGCGSDTFCTLIYIRQERVQPGTLR